MCEMYNSPVNYNSDELQNERVGWNSQEEEEEEDKVILETEITLRAGPNITMKIHEESRSNSAMSALFESEEDSDRQGVLQVLHDDSESDFHEESRKTPRTPRKVRFGGEIVKLRTPESDSSFQTEEEEKSSIKITVTDAVTIRTKRSLIPVRISSLPSTPKKSSLYQHPSQKHYKSAPNLSNNSSKIPLRKTIAQHSVYSAISSHDKSSNYQFPRKDPDKGAHVAKILKHNRAEDVLSPIPIHNEIEVFHNLTRSPERSRKNSTIPTATGEEETTTALVQFPPEEGEIFKEEKEAGIPRAYDSFKVFNEENAVPKLPDKSSVVIEEIFEDNQMNGAGGLKKPTLQQSLSSLTSDDEVWTKSEALASLVKMLKEPGTCDSLEAGPAALLLEALFACHHRDRLHSLADDALAILIEGLRRDVLEQCLSRLALSLCKMGSSSGVKCALVVMKKLPPKKLQTEVLMRGFGHRTREGALQILMACARLYPRNDVEFAKISEFAAMALRDRRRRVRQAALETLAASVQISSLQEVLSIVESVVKDFADADEVIQVVRMRLVRKQLPTVDLDGSIRDSSPGEQIESDWISGAALRTANVSPSPLSSASSSTPSVNYWMHNSRHDEHHFNNGSTLVRPLSESNEEDAFDDPDKLWTMEGNHYSKQGKMLRGSKSNLLRPVYILQPEIPISENGKNGRGHRKYDRGRSFSPPKHHRGQYPPGIVEAVPVVPVHNGSFDSENNFVSPDASSRVQYPESGAFRPHGFRKSFSSDQLYINDRLPPKQEACSFSLSSRSSSTSTGSFRSGFWQKDFRSAIPIPISESKLKIRHSSSSVLNSGGPLIVKRSRKVADGKSKTPTPVLALTDAPPSADKSVVATPSSHNSSRVRTTNIKDSDAVSNLSLPSPRSSGSDSSGYFTPSPPENHPPAFIKMDTEERLSSDMEEPLANNNSRDCADSYSVKSSVKPESLQSNEQSNELSAPNDCLGETIHDNFVSEESVDLTNNNAENVEKRPPSRNLLSPDLVVPSKIDVRRKSKSVVDLPNFLPRITSSRKNINSAPPRNEEVVSNSNNNPVNEEATLLAAEVSTSSASAPTANDYMVEQKEIMTTNVVTVTKSKLERRLSRNGSRKSSKASPKVPPESTSSRRPVSKPKDLLQTALHQLENPNWETIVDGLQGLTKLVRNNPDVIEHQIHQVCVTVAKQIKNLRSQVARIACNTASELFLSCKRGLDIELEEIACPLLQRTADTNRFLRADANAALDIMCEQLPVHRVIPVVTSRGCGHQNAVVRAASVRMLGDIVRRLGAERVFQLPKELRDRLLMAGANSLTDGNLEARSQGKALFRDLMGHPGFQRHLHEAVPQNVLRNISKVLMSIKIDS